jgi:hypothetical protein
VLTLEHDGIGTLTAFVPPTGPQLFPAFGLPLFLPDATRGEALGIVKVASSLSRAKNRRGP